MKNFNTQAIILGHKNFLENDKLVFLYSEQLGKIKVIAKGARKITSKFTGHLETLNFAEVELYFGPKNIILKEISNITTFKYLRENFEKLTASLKIAEITNKITYENQNIEELIGLIKETLQHLRYSNKTNIIIHSYILRILDKLGLVPDFKNTKTNLENKYQKYFQFIKKNPYPEIEKINLSKTEQEKIDHILNNILAGNFTASLGL